MQYSKIQKSISSLILFSLLFGLTFRVPFFDYKTYAWNSEFYDLVSIIVDQDSYDEVKTEVQRYASDIQGVLENTKVVIVPTPTNTPAFKIASLNEWLYFNGYKVIDEDTNFESKLVWTVIIWNFNLPVVFDWSKSSRTILPFTDFEDKLYIYDHKNNNYTKNGNNDNWLKSEIWHWVISPNLWDFDKNINWLKIYFNKNHDFYKWTWDFKYSEWILNWNNSDWIKSNYKPFVFYYDQFREEKALNYTLYKWYEAYLNNKEDIVYNRFTKELADKISDVVLWKATEEMAWMVNSLSDTIDSLWPNSPFSWIPDEANDLFVNWADTSRAPDVQTRFITQNMTKKFLEIFAKWIIWDFRSNVHNAWRYNGLWGEVNADLIPYLITVLDLVNDWIIKDVNTEIENKIDTLVKTGLSRKIAIPNYIKEYKSYTHNDWSWLGTGIKSFYDKSCYDLDINYLYWNSTSNINKAADCSIYRWNTDNWWKLVEANRWLNINLSLWDKNRINNLYCLQNLSSWKSLKWIWWGNSPLNIDRNNLSDGTIKLANHDVNWAIENLYSIWGSIENINWSNNPSPLDCFENNILSDTRKDWSTWSDESTCSTSFKTKETNWSCTYDNLVYKNNFNTRFEDFYKNSNESSLDGVDKDYCQTTDERWLITVFTDKENAYNIDKYYTKKVYSLNGSWFVMDYDCVKADLYKEYNFKKIWSYITHKSPIAEEIKWEIVAQMTPDLPVDRDRYIDFIWAKWNLLKIDYPALFRIEVWDKTKITLDSVSASLEASLRKKAIEINKLINDNNPNSLTWKNLKLYNILKDWSYPNANFNLLQFLRDKPSKTITVWNETKTISYYDTLVFAIYWNNLSSVSAKYGAIFDNYLNDDLESSSKYFLPKNKKQYEITYLGAPWDAKNMYIKMDPESKWENPYSDILSANLNLSSALLWANIWNKWKIDSDEALFKCAPPDWVPIWEWIPAVMCRLWEMMPPSISISDWACWPSLLDLLSDEEKSELNKCNWDFDKNWINDCIENKLGDYWILELSSDSKKYFYNKAAKLHAVFKDKNWKVVTLLNNSKVRFEIIKIESAKDNSKDISETNKKVVYDKKDEYKNDIKIISDYVTFTDLDVNVSLWKANYWIWLKWNDANVYLKAHILMNDSNDNKSLFLESNDLLLKIRWDRLFNTSYKLINWTDWLEVDGWVDYLKVNDKNNIFIGDKNNWRIDEIQNLVNNASLANEKILILLDNLSSKWKSIPIEYPINIKIKDSNNKVVKEVNFNSNDLNSFKSIAWIKKSGSYVIEIKDSKWFLTTKNLELIHEIPHTVDTHLWATVMEKWWNVSTNFFTIYDKYLNVVTWDFLDYKISIEGKGVVFLDNELDLYKGTTFEWFKVFRLKTTNNIWNNKIKVTLYDTDWNELINWSRDLDILNKINFETTSLSNEIKVWYNKYKYKIKLKDENWNLLSNFNSRVYLNWNPVYIKTSGNYVLLKNWEAEIEFETKTVAWKNIWLEFQVEWLSDIIKKEITILPWLPVKADLLMSQNKIEASPDADAVLNIELKDRYNNVVFNDNKTKTSIEILDRYSNIISIDKKIWTVKDWIWSYKLSGTLNPWVAYFKISTIPSLSNNSFIVKDKNRELTISWVWTNAWKIETFYFWNNDKIKWKKYNWLYTNLLGSNYWDIYEEWYLAWSLLFNKDNKSLAVTSLLNNPFKYSDVLKLSESWKLKVVHSSSDLTQDIEVSTEFINNKLALNLFNKSLKTYIWKIFYNYDDDINLIACDSTISSCIDEKNSSISLRSLSSDYSVYLSDNTLIFRNINWKNLFTVKSDWSIIRTWISSFSFNENNSWDYLSINIKSWSKIIWELWYSFKKWDINISRNDDSFNTKISSFKNNILVLLKTNSYWTHISWNLYNKAISFYYNDPFKNDKSLDTFSKSNTYWMENFFTKPWIWWKEWNKALLEFSAWKTVWESVKDFMSFSVINLWDPVIKLKKITKKLTWTNIDRNFDASIWKILSNDDNIISYRTFDYDDDNKIDILLIKEDKYLKLLENKDVNWWFIDKWNLALIVDLGALDLVKTGDFTWDWFDDIFFVNKKWNPFLLNNVTKDFSRYSLINEFNLSWKIVRADVFDMDNDWKTDIVTMDDAWEINIFYGWGESVKPKFTKLKVSEWNWIKLSENPRSDNSLIYFDWLHQPSENWADNSQFERYLYIKYPFSSKKEEVNYSEILAWNATLPESKASSFFMKTQYSEYSWVKIEKIFKDVNDWYLSSWDIINVNITLTNTTNNKINNIAFSERVPEVFILEQSSVNVVWNPDKKAIWWEVWFNFLISDLELNSWDQIVINYKAKVRPIQYSYMEVWLFEREEVWDDNYGDIIIKKDNQNCSNPIKLFRSTNIRSYLLWSRVPICDSNKSQLPPELEKNTIDVNWNWIPDYIDELFDPNNTTAMQNYASEQLSNMNKDSDEDWVPNDEDFLEWSVLKTVFWGTDSSVEIGMWDDFKKIDEQLDWIQEVLNWLSCWNASCFASPLNWAPLAPWSDPVFMWNTVWDWLKIDEWLPVISAMTGLPLYGPWWCIPIPMIWPISPIWLDTTCSSNSLWAWGRLWIDSVTNFFRMFITPTLTGWIWTAICFWWPASVMGNILPEALSPLFPGWNCIVIAKKMDFCNWDWSGWDVWSIWIPQYWANASFWIINWNCWTSQTPLEKSKEDNRILKKLVDWDKKGLVEKIFWYLPWNFSEEPITPLFTQWWEDVSITLDLSTDDDWNFWDIIKIQQTRISSFPSWLMDWVTRQIEEIANKLTDFPTLFIILPDFSWVFDSTWWETSWNDNKSSKNAITSDNKIIWEKVEKVNSWIKEAYEFIWSLPLVYIKQETVDISLPWISKAEIDKTILLREWTLKQREDEINRAKEEIKDLWNGNISWNINGDINIDFDIDFLLDWLRNNLEVIKEYKKIPEKINKLINLKQDYLEQILCNIEIISNVLWWRIWKNGDRFKAWVELYILIKAILKSWQMLIDVFIDFESECHECKNERQDALDSEFNLINMVVPKIPIITWPKWPDIILDLHNIRAWLTVSLPEFAVHTKPIILPTLPALYLPSLPDINIDASLDIDLSLLFSEMLKMDWIDLPQLPVLPDIEIPELPPIPSLPTVNLPDLPPPPKLPKMLWSIEVVLGIIKLLTKAMCMLKSLPIAPEWRAGDQIAFLTERSWYLWSDFFEISMPEFSFPFIDAIKVTTYVNLEFDTDFIVELARQIVMPINNISNDFTNIFSAVLPDLDLRGALPKEINIDVNIDTETIKKLSEWDLSPLKDQFGANKKGIKKDFKDSREKLWESLNNFDEWFKKAWEQIKNNTEKLWNELDATHNQLKEAWNNIKNYIEDKNTGYVDKKKLQILLATKVWADFKQLVNVLDKWRSDVVSNTEFKQLVNKALASKIVTSEPRMQEILNVWNEVNKMTYSKEETIIKELQNNNREKFNALSDIINTEIIKNKEFKNKIKNIWLIPVVTKVWLEDSNKINLYNDALDVFNNKFKDSAKKLFKYDGSDKKELKEMSNDLMSKIKTPLQNYSKWMVEKSRENILASVTNNEIALNTTTSSSSNSCSWNESNSQYKREYKWLYILEKGHSYRLFDYLDELEWNEVTNIIDIDNDGDDDLLYFAANRLYFKENLKYKDTKVHVNTNPIIVDSSDNKFYNWDIFYESINNSHEIGSDNWSINIWFTSPTNESLSKFRLAFYNRVDKYINENNTDYRPKFIKRDIIDSVSDIEKITEIETTWFYIKRKNLVYIKNVWKLSGAKVVTKEAKDISSNLVSWKVININKWTILYAWSNSFTIRFVNEETEDKTEHSLKVNWYENIEFVHNIKIVWIDGNVYIKWFDDITFEWTDVRKLLNKPLFAGTIISYEWNNYETVDSSYVELQYYDNSELSIDFNEVSKWELYDLGLKTNDYSIRVKRDNDYYYAKIKAFDKNIIWTLSKQILIAPQNEADLNAPELTLPSIRIPVYQGHIVDLTNDIYEDSWIKNIKKVIIDFDLTKDTDNDWNPKNDDDLNIDWEYKDQIEILKNLVYLKLNFKSFDKLFKKKIGITLIDNNDNIWYSEVLLEVYSPVPHINKYDNWLISWILKDEILTKEPVNLYRFRWGVVTKLDNKSWSGVSLTDKWSYDFNVKTSWTGLKLYDWWKNEIAFIDEKTWKIFIKDHSITTDVLSTSNRKNDSVFPKILLKKNGEEIFYEYLEMKWIKEVKFVNNFEEVIDKWIYFKFSDYTNYSYYTIPLWLDYNPWALSIYRNTSIDKEALFTLFTDWRINTINDNDFSLKYDFYWENIVLKLYDKNDFWNREIGRILFKTESEYIMK